MLRGILIGLDGSATSAAAVELGIRWAASFKARLVGVGVVDQPNITRPEPTGIGGDAYKQRRDQHLLADARRQVEGFLKQFSARCGEAACTTVLAVGHPYAQILQAAERLDLILLGQRPRFHFETQETDADTVRKVLMHSPHPVVVVPERLPSGNAVVAAYDGSVAAARALQTFVASGLAEGKDIHVIAVHPDCAAAERHVEQAVEYLRLHELVAQPHPAATRRKRSQVVLDAVRQYAAGLVVMGAYGRSRLRELLFGSMTCTLLRDSPAPVFLSH